MKISQETIDALKNLATINESIVIREGNTQKSVALAKNILATITTIDKFPKSFGIYDLSEFLNVLSSMEDPDIEFGEKSAKITSGSMSTRFVYSDKSNIHPEVPAKEIDEIMPESDLTFELKKEDLNSSKKMASILSLDDVVITSENGNLLLRVTDLSSDSSNNSDIVIGKYEGNDNFSFNFKITRFSLLPDDYEVRICARLISHWIGKTNDAEYLISLEKTSSFN